MKRLSRSSLGVSLATALSLAGSIALESGCSSTPTNYAKGSRSSASKSASKKPGEKVKPSVASDDTPDKADSAFSDPVAKGALRERAIALLTAAATGPSPEQRANAIEALGAVPTRLEAILRSALLDESPAVRTVAAAMVGRAVLTSSASFVEPLTRDSFVMTRASALYSLKRCGQDPDLTPFTTFLEDPSPKVRSHAAFLLGEIGDPSAIGLLRDAAHDPMPRATQSDVKLMQLQIAEARIKLGDDTALPEVRAALFPARNEDLEATALAAQIVGQVQDRASINQLINLASMKDNGGKPMPPEIRLASAGALAHLGLSQGAFVAREYLASKNPALRAQTAYVLGETGQVENLVPLDVLMKDENGLVRVAAASAALRISGNSTPKVSHAGQ